MKADLASCLGLLSIIPLCMPAQSPPGARDTLIGIAIERRLSDAAHLVIGDTIHLSSSATPAERLARIDAIYEPSADPSTVVRRDFHIRLHLADLARELGQPDRVDRIGIVLQPGVAPESAVARLNRTAFGYEIMSSHDVASTSSTTFMVVSRFHRAIAIISVLASTVFLLCIMLLKVEERRRDVAMLRFTGISRRTVFIALLLEAAAIALAGSILGTGIAAAAGAMVNAHYQRVYDTALVFSELTPSSVLFAGGLSILLGLIAGGLAAWRLVRIPPVKLWSRAA